MCGVEVGLAGRASPAGPEELVPHPCSAWAAGLPRSEWPGQELFRPPSLLCSTHGLSHPWGPWPSPGHPGLSAVHI